MAARIRSPSLVCMDVSNKFYYLDHCSFVAAADLFAIPQTNRRRTALLRSDSVPTLDNVDTVLRSDRGVAFRNARGPAGFEQVRSALPRSWAIRDRKTKWHSTTNALRLFI